MTANPKPILYLLSGLPFAGKSTWAKQLAKPLGAAIIEADAYIAVVDAQSPGASKLEHWRAVQTLARSAAKMLLTQGLSVIFDDLQVKPDVRAEMTRLAQACGASVLTLSVDTPLETIRERQHRQSSEQKQRDAWEARTQELLLQRVPPEKTEAVSITPDSVLDEILAEIARHLKQN